MIKGVILIKKISLSEIPYNIFICFFIGFINFMIVSASVIILNINMNASMRNVTNDLKILFIIFLVGIINEYMLAR